MPWIPAAALLEPPQTLFGLNVKDFGAKGDGSTDDLIPIQAAIDAAWATASSGAAGNIIFFPQGIYMVSDTVSIVQSYVRLYGANDNAVRIKATSGFATTTGKPVIQCGPKPTGNGDISGVTLENLRVDCNTRASVGVNWNDANEHCAMINVEVRNFMDKGTFVTASNALVIDRFGAVGAPVSTALYPIHLSSNSGMIWLTNLSNLSTGRSPTPSGSAGVRINSTPMTSILNIHGEQVEDLVNFNSGSGDGNVVVAYGHSTDVNIVHITSGYNAGASITYEALALGGASGVTFLDNR